MCVLCSVERAKAPVLVVVMNGGFRTLEAAQKAVAANVPVLVFADSGGAAGFIFAAYDRREQPLVLH